jgi:hypothetical protein
MAPENYVKKHRADGLQTLTGTDLVKIRDPTTRWIPFCFRHERCFICRTVRIRKDFRRKTKSASGSCDHLRCTYRWQRRYIQTRVESDFSITEISLRNSTDKCSLLLRQAHQYYVKPKLISTSAARKLHLREIFKTSARWQQHAPRRKSALILITPSASGVCYLQNGTPRAHPASPEQSERGPM